MCEYDPPNPKVILIYNQVWKPLHRLFFSGAWLKIEREENRRHDNKNNERANSDCIEVENTWD